REGELEPLRGDLARPLYIASAKPCLGQFRQAPGIRLDRCAAFSRDRLRALEGLDRRAPVSSEPFREAEMNPRPGTGEGVTDPVRELQLLAGLRQRRLGIAGEVREPD